MTYKFHTFRSLTRALVFIGALAATALGCVWLGTSESVLFNDHYSYRDMGRLPPLPTLAEGSNTLRETWENEDSYPLDEKDSRAVDGFWESAAVFEKDGKTTDERNRLIEYVNRTR